MISNEIVHCLCFIAGILFLMHGINFEDQGRSDGQR